MERKSGSFSNNDSDKESYDDKDTIIVTDFDTKDEISMNGKTPKGVNLDLSFAADSKTDHDSNTHREGIQEETLLVVFDLPDGSQGESMFKLGQTVEVLKSYIESEYGIPMQEQALFLEDKKMLDPFSLLDYPEAKGVYREWLI